MKKRKFLLITFVILMFASLNVQADDGFAISQAKATINVGDTLELSTTGTDKAPSWTSYSDNIVNVNTHGEVTGLKKGKTTVRARVGSAYRTCAVTVVDSDIKLNKQSAVIYHGGTSINTVKLKATVKGASKDIAWQSSDTDIAEVDNTGKVTSVSEGTAVITAIANSKSAACVITVKESSLSLNMDNIQLSTKGIGSSIKIAPIITGSKRNIRWTISDKAIATVAGGKVTGKKTGTATIMAEANGVSAVCEVTVVEGLISINEEKVILYVGGTKQETKQLKTNAVKTDVVTWLSSNTDVATVDANGLVKPVSAGTAIISAECNGKADTCEVTVKQTSLNIEEDSIVLKTKGTDKTYALNKEIVGSSTKVKWTTSNKKVATVSNGKIMAKKAGTAIITASANGVSDSVVVNVADYDPSIKLSHGQYALFTVNGNTVILKAAVDGTSKTVRWHSSDDSVAAVNDKGKVTAINAGTAIITAQANGVSAECLITVKESKIIFDRDSISLDKGEGFTVGYDIIGTKQSVKWSTTNRRVVAVKNGTLTAKEFGEADIMATANGVTAICHVRVVSCKHQYEKTVAKQPTCAEPGTIIYTCSLCGDSYKEEIAPTGEHSFEWRTVLEPTCTENGHMVHECGICGHIEKEREIEALGHDWSEWGTVTFATSESAGLKRRTCTRCDEFEELEIPPVEEEHEHEYIAAVTEPTCNDQGYTTYVCICGDSYTDDIVEALGHNFGEWIVVKEATETEEGSEERICQRCGEKETNAIPMNGHEHNYIVYEVVDPTCQLEGYTEYICTECRCTYIDDYTEPDPEAHNLAKNEREPSCTLYGVLQIYCKNKNCGYYSEEITPALGHDYQILEEDRKELTGYYGNESSYSYYIEECSRCGRHYEEYTLDPYCENTEWDKENGYILIGPEGYEGQIRFNSFLREELLPYVTFKFNQDFGNNVSLSEDGFVKVSAGAWPDPGIFLAEVSLKDNPYNASIGNYNKTYVGFYLLSPSDVEEQEKVRRVIDEVIKDDMDDAEKILAIHDWLCLNCEYDYSFSFSSYYSYGAIVEGKAVCEGYGLAFKKFMDKLGIECNFVSSTSANHGWNQVKIEDEWYWLDCTWDDSLNSRAYFLRNEVRAEDEKGGTDCTGTKWQFGLPIFRKYYVSSDSDLNDVYSMQKSNLFLYFMFNSSSEFNDRKYLFNISSEYQEKYQESLAITSISVDEEYIVYVQNSDKLKALFEERIAMAGANDEDSEVLTESAATVNSGVDEPDNYREQESGETDDVNESDGAGEIGDIDNSDIPKNNGDVIGSYNYNQQAVITARVC